MSISEKKAFSRKMANLVWLWLFFIIALFIGLVSNYTYQFFRRNYRAQVENQLSSIGMLKVRELTHWRDERLGDARLFYQNPVFTNLARRYLDEPSDPQAKNDLRVWMRQVQTSYGYERVMLLDDQYKKRLIYPDQYTSEISYISPAADLTLKAGQIAFEDFYLDEENQQIYLKLLVPLMDDQNSGKLLGVLALRIQPYSTLYPVINEWPIPNKTAETMLVRRDGDDALVLNELVHQHNTALKSRIPLSMGDVPAVRAALGEEGVVEGIDCRGILAVADVRDVPGTPWFLVSRIDYDEVYAPVRERLWIQIISALALIAAVGALMAVYWRQSSASFYKEQYRIGPRTANKSGQSAHHHQRRPGRHSDDELARGDHLLEPGCRASVRLYSGGGNRQKPAHLHRPGSFSCRPHGCHARISAHRTGRGSRQDARTASSPHGRRRDRRRSLTFLRLVG